MTYANLPAKKVAEACRLAESDFEQLSRDDMEGRARVKALVDTGKWTEEQREASNKFLDADARIRSDQRHRARAVRDLALAAGDSTIAVNATDFQTFAKFYPRETSTP